MCSLHFVLEFCPRRLCEQPLLLLVKPTTLFMSSFPPLIHCHGQGFKPVSAYKGKVTLELWNDADGQEGSILSLLPSPGDGKKRCRGTEKEDVGVSRDIPCQSSSVVIQNLLCWGRKDGHHQSQDARRCHVAR